VRQLGGSQARRQLLGYKRLQEPASHSIAIGPLVTAEMAVLTPADMGLQKLSLWAPGSPGRHMESCLMELRGKCCSWTQSLESCRYDVPGGQPTWGPRCGRRPAWQPQSRGRHRGGPSARTPPPCAPPPRARRPPATARSKHQLIIHPLNAQPLLAQGALPSLACCLPTESACGDYGGTQAAFAVAIHLTQPLSAHCVLPRQQHLSSLTASPSQMHGTLVCKSTGNTVQSILPCNNWCTTLCIYH
jgi:hypothetical protein